MQNLEQELEKYKQDFAYLFNFINTLSVEYGSLSGSPNIFEDLEKTLQEAKANRKLLAECLNLKEQVVLQKQKITHYKEIISSLEEDHRRKNVMLDALYMVWCSGGCSNGVGRYLPNKVTQEIVDAAVRNTERLVQWWKTYQYRKEHNYDKR